MKKLRNIFKVAFVLMLSISVGGSFFVCPVSGQGVDSSPSDFDITKIPVNKNVMYIDNDGDGYGIGPAPNGQDADDNDPTVTTYESAIAKYGSIESFLQHLGYHPDRIIYVDTSCVKNGTCILPQSPKAGDVFIFKEGVYRGRYVLKTQGSHGTEEKPIVFIAEPGKSVVIEATANGIGTGNKTSSPEEMEKVHHIVWDGFQIKGIKTENTKWGGNGVKADQGKNLVFKNLYIHGFENGIDAMQDLRDILVDKCVIAKNGGTHGIYFGCRQFPNKNITVKNSLFYENGRHGIQHNGRVTNLVLEGNIIHSNNLGAVSLIEGVSGAVVKNNLMFNNNKQGVIFYGYDEPKYKHARPYDQNNNLVENNIIWVGEQSWNDSNKNKPSYYEAIRFSDSSKDYEVNMKNNIVRNNILISHSYTAIWFSHTRIFNATIVENNVFYKTRKDVAFQIRSRRSQEGAILYTIEEAQNINSLIKNNTFRNPGFIDVSVDYYKNPKKFNFNLIDIKDE